MVAAVLPATSLVVLAIVLLSDNRSKAKMAQSYMAEITQTDMLHRCRSGIVTWPCNFSPSPICTA